MIPDSSSSTVCVGIDMVEVPRIERTLSRWGDRFLQRVYTPHEIEKYEGRLPSLAARFAAKEAVMKALGCGRSGVAWRDVEVLSLPGGSPCVLMHGRAAKKSKELGIEDFSVSLSHTREYAVAVVAGLAGPSTSQV